MSEYRLPRGLTLPSGRRVSLRPHDGATNAATETSAELFALERRVLDARVTIEERGARVAIDELALGDFHLLRAVATKAGLLDEEAFTFACHNCGKELDAEPCALLETGPWEDDEASDPELDRALEPGTEIAIPPIALGRVREAKTVVFAPRTVGEARPLFRALARSPLTIDEDFVRGMGLARLDRTTDPARIARALEAASDDAFAAVVDAFLDTHYVPRLAGDVFCPQCGARSTIDAPAERELERAERPPKTTATRPLPPLEEFVELTDAIAAPLLAALPRVPDMLPVEVVVEDGTPAVDDGGEPLLGSYVPPPPRDALAPQRPPLVTVYYRTFAAVERDEGDFDWEDELRETIEHELEHHVYFLRGDDPMDEEEHAAIDREAIRIIGPREVSRRALVAAGSSVPDFVRRAWPLIAIGAAVLALTVAEGHCGN